MRHLLIVIFIVSAAWLDAGEARPKPARAGEATVSKADDPESGGSVIQGRETTVPADWSVPVPGFVAPAPNEHPRLLWRTTQAETMRARSAAPVGRRIAARVRAMLDHGYKEHWAAGITCLAQALLYQADGGADRATAAYRDLMAIVAKRLENDRDFNDTIRGDHLTFSLAFALTYDLAHPGWTPQQRSAAAQALWRFAGRYGPDAGSAPACSACHIVHAHQAGIGLIWFALQGDDGLDAEVQRTIAARLDWLQGTVRRELHQGRNAINDSFSAAHFCPRTPMSQATYPYLLALRSAGGRDLISPWRDYLDPTVQHWLWETVRAGPTTTALRPLQGQAEAPLAYGDFALGFGLVPPSGHGLLRWAWRNLFNGSQEQADRLEIGDRPLAAVYAWAFWPLDEEPPGNASLPPNLAKVMTGLPGMLAVRNAWTGQGTDLVCGISLGDRAGDPNPRSGQVVLVGGGFREPLAAIPPSTLVATSSPGPDLTLVQAATVVEPWLRDHGVPAGGDSWSMLIDYSGKSGSPFLAVLVQPGRTIFLPSPDPEIHALSSGIRWWRFDLAAGARRLSVFTIAKERPQISVADGILSVGARRLRLDDGALKPADP